jgi:hypothetical protein
MESVTDSESLEALVHNWLVTKEAAERLRLRACEAQAAARDAWLAPQYESYQELTEARARLGDANDAKENADRAYRLVEEQRRKVEQQIKEKLPARVWVRFGQIGVGVAFTNWGGPSHYLISAPWQPEMSTLDHTYRGD